MSVIPRVMGALLSAALLSSAGAQVAQSAAKSQATNAAVSVTAAIVLSDLSVRPLPLQVVQFRLVADTSQKVELRTGLDGKAAIQLAPGTYELRTLQAVLLNDSAYTWNVRVDVTASGKSVELSNANAIVAPARRAARQVAPERDVFEVVRRAVFRVESGLGHGSGFLAAIPDADGVLVLTNDHVVGTENRASVYIDSITRVPAIVVARDKDADLAVLRLPDNRCSDCPKLVLALGRVGDSLVVAGERVLAIGFPLSQQMTLTTGVASSIRAGAIVSDVNINHGNSGGPMLNLAGEVVGVNAFGDFTSQGGPGISGAIAISKAEPLLKAVPEASRRVGAPEDRLLPFFPQGVYPQALIKAAADSVNPKDYRRLLEKSAGKFTLNVTTPVLYRVALRLAEAEVSQDRRRREKAANVSSAESYSELTQQRDWEQYVGSESAPVVTVTITPKVGETFGSAFLRGMAAQGGNSAQASFVFQGDVRGARFYRNGIEVEPIRGGHGPQAVNVENAVVKLKDVADRGYYVLPPEAFEPDSVGAPARVTIVVSDLKHPDDPSVTEIEGQASARIWNDFQAYFESGNPSKKFLRANPKMKSPKVTRYCDLDGTCRGMAP